MGEGEELKLVYGYVMFMYVRKKGALLFSGEFEEWI